MELPPGGLYGLLSAAAARSPGRTAVVDPGRGAISYRDLDALSCRVCDILVARGVGHGDRVGIYLTKSIDAVAVLFGILRAGAAYVPVDPHGPAGRNAFILNDCGVSLVFVEQQFAKSLDEELSRLGSSPSALVVDGPSDGTALGEALDRDAADQAAPRAAAASVRLEALAYILYTSGSTGQPKGVMLSQFNALSYVQWCTEIFRPTENDRFSSHAPFHFDLSILDLFLPLMHGAALVLVAHDAGKDPGRLAPLIAEHRLTVWYSAPSILTLLAEHGALGSHDYSSLRLVLFAGEVFPVKHLRRLQQQLPHARYFNLYGPTETNVCTFHEIPCPVPDDRIAPYPIGVTCSHLASRITDREGREVPPGVEGELSISGPGVMLGYWERPAQTANAFFVDGDERRWYRTGDVVVDEGDGILVFRGRRDRMIKKRGYRVELGEIEVCLYRHPEVREAAVVARENDEGVKVQAFVTSQSGERLSVIGMKQYCAERLPLYMVPDGFTFLPLLPRTSTDKISYERLKELV